ncbi:MAG: pyridoxamine 5'-phosphate oxidase family protein [Candidatus Doudnabacteria bacterium]
MTDGLLKHRLEKLRDFISEHKLAVIATVEPHYCLPQAAVVGFSIGKHFELYFGTSVYTRKYINIQKNPRVAFVIGWTKGKTVQYEGEAVELTAEEILEYKQNALGDVPSIAKYIHDEEMVFYKVKPKMIKYSDLSVDPWEVFELERFNY